MNGGEGGITNLDRAALILAGIGFLLFRLGAHLWRTVDDNLWTETDGD